MSGSFDPPTRAHKRIIKAALGAPGIKKLYILVNTTGVKDYKASAGERQSMLHRMLRSLRPDRLADVELLPVEQASKSETVNAIARRHRLPLVQVIGEDSFRDLPAGVSKDPRRRWLVVERPAERRPGDLPVTERPGRVKVLRFPGLSKVSSTQARQALERGKAGRGLDAVTASYIDKHHLYQAPKGQLLRLQQQLYKEGFQSFASDVRSRLPQLKPAKSGAPPFEATQSQAGWADKLTRWLVEKHELKGEEANAARAVAREVLSGWDQVHPKLPYLQPASLSKRLPTPHIRSVRKVPVTRPDQGDRYTIDVQAYVKDRIPLALQRHIARHKIPVYLHRGKTSEALALHAAQGFTELYEVRSRRNQNRGQTHLLVNPGSGRSRMIISAIRGEDNTARLLTELGATKGPQRVTLVEHDRAQPVLRWSAEARRLRWRKDDHVVIGFSRAISKQLEATGQWQRQRLTQEGVEVDLYINKATGQRIVNTSPVYGDQIRPLVQAFYKRGVRRFTYLGTAGALAPSFKVGDIVLPQKIKDRSGRWISFDNRAAGLLDAKDGPRLRKGVRHGWTQTVLQETDRYLKKELSSGVQTLDVEGMHFADCFRRRQGEASLVLVVSDTPLGRHTLDAHGPQSPASRLVGVSISRVVDRLLSPAGG